MCAQVIGGTCHVQCISCGHGEVYPQLLIHSSYRGTIQARGSESSMSKEQQAQYENLSYDNTLLQLSDKLCPKCKTPLRVWLTQNHLYVYLCPSCHVPVQSESFIRK